MKEYVIKRDNTQQIYDESRIYSAINKAKQASNEDVDIPLIMERVHKRVDKMDPLTVENIQDAVVHCLISSRWKKTAEMYIGYRKERDLVREMKSDLVVSLMSFINGSNDAVNKDNANKNSKDVATNRDLIAGIVSKEYGKKFFMSDAVRKAVDTGFMYFHDSDYMLSPALLNCCLVNYPDMLENGFKLGDAEIETPKSIRVASDVLTQIVQFVANHQYGGQTLCEIDKYLKPYVVKSENKLKAIQEKYNISDPNFVPEQLDKLVYDAMQNFFYEINTLHSVNGQSPFITISFGLDMSYYGRMITRNYLKIHILGLGKKHATSVFPKVVFILQKGINMDPMDPNYDLKRLAMECTTKRIYPDFISYPLNKMVTGAKNQPVTSMGCRSFLSFWENPLTGEEQYLGRANLGVVSVILPTIAKFSKVEGKDFWKTLDYFCELSYTAHMERINRSAKVKAKNNPMFMYGALARLDPEEEIGQLFYDGRFTASLGYIGVAEACELLYGHLDKEKAIEIVSFLDKKCKEWQERSRIHFSVYGTPAETLCYKAVVSYNKLFPNDPWHREYFTNSFHQPVWIESDPFEKWDYEKGFAKLSSGGNIGYIETSNLKDNQEALESLIDYGYETIPYFGFNQPVDQCFECGYEGEFEVDENGYYCPVCGNRVPSKMSVIRRVCGYLSNPEERPFIKGKAEEVKERVKHN